MGQEVVILVFEVNSAFLHLVDHGAAGNHKVPCWMPLSQRRELSVARVVKIHLLATATMAKVF